MSIHKTAPLISPCYLLQFFAFQQRRSAPANSLSRMARRSRRSHVDGRRTHASCMAAPNQDVGPFTPQRDEPVAETQVDIDMTHMASCRQIFPVRVDPDKHSSEVFCCDCGVRMTGRCVLMTMASGWYRREWSPDAPFSRVATTDVCPTVLMTPLA